MTSEYRWGEPVHLSATFTAGDPPEPADPSGGVTLEVLQPDGTVLTPTPSHDGEGAWSYDLVPDATGIWRYRFAGSGDLVQAHPGSFRVLADVFEPVDLVLPGDYFSRAEFSAWARDDAVPPAYPPEMISDAQAEVIERLEQWARTSWANVDLEAVAPGDGFTNVNRTHTELASGGGVLVLARIPVLEVASVTIEGATDPLAADSYRPDLAAGIIRIGSAVAGVPISISDPLWDWSFSVARFEVVYSFGFGSCPRSVKVPAMAATRSRIDVWQQQRAGTSGRIPPNTRRLSSSRTDLDFGPDAGSDEPAQPWPWDEAASRELVAWWGPRRPVRRLEVFRAG